MRKLILNIVMRFFGKENIIKSVDLLLVKEKIEKSRIDECLRNSSTGIGTQFHSESKVENFQGNPSLINIGDNTHIRGQLLIFKYGGKIKIGTDCYIGEGTKIWSGDSIEIGNNVLISHNVNIIDTNSHEINSKIRNERYKDLLLNGHWVDKGEIITEAIVIEDNAWISFGVIILKGVKIGKGAIVAAGAVVTKDVDEWTIVAGNPAEVKRKIPIEER